MRGGRAGGQSPLMDVRDRVFHALFYRVTLTYARAFPKPIRRLLEFVIFLKVGYCGLQLFHSLHGSLVVIIKIQYTCGSFLIGILAFSN